MKRHFKQVRTGRRLYEASSDPTFFDQVHVIFGGTGAVGGETAVQLISFFEEARRYAPTPPERMPRIVVTAHTHKEIREFTRVLFGIHQRDHGVEPERLEGTGYRIIGGTVIEMRTLSIEPSIPEMRNAGRAPEASLADAARQFLDRVGVASGADEAAIRDALLTSIREEGARPFSKFLEAFRDERGLPTGDARFRGVTVTIPLASVATYQLGDLEAFARALGIESAELLGEIKETYLGEFPEDLANVAKELADEVLVAHTTGVGGMYDEAPDGMRTIRVGFAHSALGEKLRQKQLFAERLTDLYSARGIRILVTAAAIGVDAILPRQNPPLQNAVRQRLENTIDRTHRIVPSMDVKAGTLHVYRPLVTDLFKASHDPLSFTSGRPLMFDHVLKSGENGWFTVPNADALYRVMRVASATELGLVLAKAAVFGDDPQYPTFVDNISYYTETDYSRQVFDLLGQPMLVANQLSGLQPKALQDLGSAKHQGELHTLGLLMLLHRLKTLDFSAIEPRVDLTYFDPMTYFEEHSRYLTFEDVQRWDAVELADQLRTLVTATTIEDLSRFQQVDQPYPERQEAVRRVLDAVLRAVWAVPSLGTPILFDQDGRTQVVTGFYAAPIDRIQTHHDSISAFLREDFELRGKATGHDKAAFGRFSEFHFANGFADLRPQATVVSAHTASENLVEAVTVCSTRDELLDALDTLEPYTYFTTSGLVALVFRLKALARMANELSLELGTANEFRAHLARDERGHAIVVPGVVESFRMVSEGLEKNTGGERLDGPWGYTRHRRRPRG